jgi:hypothetical protein
MSSPHFIPISGLEAYPVPPSLFAIFAMQDASGVRSLEKPGLLMGIAAILSAIAWPILVAVVLYWFRRPIENLVATAVGIAASSSKVKIWQIEFDRDVQQQLEATAQEALSRQPSVSEHQIGSPIPAAEVQAAARVRSLIDEAPPGSIRREIQESIRQRMLGFAKEYESTRAAMHAGPDRTRAMNAIAAKMRTLALAADPFLDELAHDPDSSGRRLAAICILQLVPGIEWVPWLADRMAVEQPFVFFHASVALLSAVRKYGSQQKEPLRAAITRALAQVKSFGENCDINTVRSLTLALSELETS